MTFCVLTYFFEFYALVLYEIYVGGSKLVYDNIWVVKFREWIPMDYPRVLEEEPMLVGKSSQGSDTYKWQTAANGLVDTP